MTIWIVTAFLLDLLIGDPYNWPHPIKCIGNFIDWFQRRYTQTKSENEKYRWGILLFFVTVFGTGLITYIILKISFLIHPFFGTFCYVYLAYTTLATKSLSLEGKKVYQKLTLDTLNSARKQVAMIVGRDTSELTEEEITKATIETVAENTSDGVVAPLLYLFIGGPVLAMMYKAVNTLDSMVGYVTPKYQAIGWFSAKMDDLWNFIPARLTWLFLLASAKLLNLNVANAWAVGKKDCRKHKSPNSGFPESIVAGALGIQLGGTHCYHGVEIYKPTIGVTLRSAEPRDILITNTLLYVTSILSLSIFSSIAIFFTYYLF
ncbi:cobalamin biosynthesis protein CobD [Enterococcus raffinosus]|uniref:adenosylcobinamide-phosphate synthase CbiB n=1 Tax=Enterococcus raffinosus TaxID=71452 RepID=UPI001C484A09|nr:adenosylcobinamide-phosphate synthase CbiB [Enterococcus raffinosus]QXJ60381.1 cobalamin biosynthesis protein CobD [Enterococcus raffinosus]